MSPQRCPECGQEFEPGPNNPKPEFGEWWCESCIEDEIARESAERFLDATPE